MNDLRGGFDGFLLFIGMAGGANNKRHLEVDGSSEKVFGENGEGKVDGRIRPGECLGEIFAGVVGCVDGGAGFRFDRFGDRPAHAPERPVMVILICAGFFGNANLSRPERE